MFFWGAYFLSVDEQLDLSSAPVSYSTLSRESIALSSRIGMTTASSDDDAQVSELAIQFGQDIKSLDTFFDYYFTILSQYEAILDTDVSSMIQSSNNKSLALDTYLDQSRFQYERATSIIASFQTESLAISSSLQNIELQISALHTQVQNAFASRSTDGVISLTHQIETLRSQHQYLRTRLVFLGAHIYDHEARNTLARGKLQAK